jgi:glyoxylase-like metal-dependent hydrolase (beta-lactamase superfamily II)
MENNRMWISPKVYMIPINSKTFQPLYTTTNIYLIGRRERVMIDAGYAHKGSFQQVVHELQRLGNPRVTHLIITHGHKDHFDGVEKIKRLTGAKVLAHYLETGAINGEFSQRLVDETLEDDDILEIDGSKLKTIHTPGHSNGHICLYFPDDKVLFTGDHIVGISTVVVKDMTAYLASLEKLLNYPAQKICPAHGPVMDDAQEKIKEYYDHRLAREKQIIDTLRAGGHMTSHQLMLKVYAVELDERFYWVAERQIVSHLDKLEKEGRVAHTGGGPDAVYSVHCPDG